jgi:hypothetical protein
MMMRGTVRRAALGSLVALALVASALGPCHCVLTGGACHQERPEADAHACCEKPTGVQAAADECCDDAPELVLASTDVPEVARPALQAGPVALEGPANRSVPVADVRLFPPPSLDRTTVLLI